MLRQDFQAPDGVGQTFMPGDAGVPTQNVGTIPQFYMGTEVDGDASREAGRIIHKNVEMVLILFAGSNNQSMRRKVLPHDQKAYARQYAAFKSGQVQRADGTSLSEWPMIDRAKAESYKIANIFTVEQLANLSDGDLMGLGMGAEQWRQKAIDWLQVSAGNADQMALMEKMRDMQDQMARLSADNAALKQTVDNQNRIAEISSAKAAGLNPAAMGMQAPVPEDAKPTDPALDRMLLEANGLDPDTQHASQAAHEASAQRLEQFGDDYAPLELNTETLEAE